MAAIGDHNIMIELRKDELTDESHAAEKRRTRTPYGRMDGR